VNLFTLKRSTNAVPDGKENLHKKMCNLYASSLHKTSMMRESLPLAVVRFQPPSGFLLSWLLFQKVTTLFLSIRRPLAVI
jgi:hypothetical protein